MHAHAPAHMHTTTRMYTRMYTRTTTRTHLAALPASLLTLQLALSACCAQSESMLRGGPTAIVQIVLPAPTKTTMEVCRRPPDLRFCFWRMGEGRPTARCARAVPIVALLRCTCCAAAPRPQLPTATSAVRATPLASMGRQRAKGAQLDATPTRLACLQLSAMRRCRCRRALWASLPNRFPTPPLRRNPTGQSDCDDCEKGFYAYAVGAHYCNGEDSNC